MSTEPLPPLGSPHGDVRHISAHRFGIAAGMSGWGWHAVDFEAMGRRLAEVINEVAAEHVSLQCDGADALAARVRNAGAIFIGKANMSA